MSCWCHDLCLASPYFQLMFCQKLQLPIYSGSQSTCGCNCPIDKFGDHFFTCQCFHPKTVSHNMIRDALHRCSHGSSMCSLDGSWNSYYELAVYTRTSEVQFEHANLCTTVSKCTATPIYIVASNKVSILHHTRFRNIHPHNILFTVSDPQSHQQLFNNYSLFTIAAHWTALPIASSLTWHAASITNGGNSAITKWKALWDHPPRGYLTKSQTDTAMTAQHSKNNGKSLIRMGAV